jgi:hypothetical protein
MSPPSSGKIKIAPWIPREITSATRRGEYFTEYPGTMVRGWRVIYPKGPSAVKSRRPKLIILWRCGDGTGKSVTRAGNLFKVTEVSCK